MKKGCTHNKVVGFKLQAFCWV